MSRLAYVLILLSALPATGKEAPPDEAPLVAVVEKNKLAMKLCYQRALRREPDLRLKMVTRVRIDGGGKVTKVSFGDAQVAREEIGLCLADAIKRWEFPEAGQEYGFEFPIVLMRD